MEGLRQTLLVPASGTFMMVWGCASALKEMVKHRYAVKDDNGKPVLPHPYKPWEPVDEKHKEGAEKAFRSFKMWENVKEWTFLSLGPMWIWAIFGGAIPGLTQPMVDGATIASCLVYTYANHQYAKGYCEAANKRIGGFYLRMKVVHFWLFGAGASLGFYLLQRFGVVDWVANKISN